MGQGGPIDINVAAVYRAMDERDIPKELQLELKNQVRALVHHMINKWNEDSKTDGG